ncbi:MFS transporter [Brenneria uluponensis]|uniref:MFS transporter n=1 Tax=Brenneria uluponensis TaxID=3057057 RepID=UPI0028ED0D51|nr:MFS transporter [Brenneria ulupoensis]
MNRLLLQFTYSKIIAVGLSVLIPVFLAQRIVDADVFASYRAIEYVPYILVGIIVGASIDSWGAGVIMRWSLYLHLLPLLVLILVYNEWLPIQALYVALLIMSAVAYSVSAGTSRTAYDVLPKEDLGNFNARTSLFEQIVTVVVPLVMGWALTRSLQLTLIMLIVFSFIVSLITPHYERQNEISKVPCGSLFVSRIKNGIKAFRINRVLMQLSLIIMLINAIETAPATLMVFYATHELKLSALDTGTIITAAGIGGIVGAWLLSFISKKPSLLLGLLVASMLVNALLYFLVYKLNNYPILMVSMFIESLSIVVSSVSFRTLRQLCSDPASYGTTLGISGAMVKCGIPIATLFGGYIAWHAGVRQVYLLTAISELVLTFPVTLWAIQSHRKSVYEI